MRDGQRGAAETRIEGQGQRVVPEPQVSLASTWLRKASAALQPRVWPGSAAPLPRMRARRRDRRRIRCSSASAVCLLAEALTKIHAHAQARAHTHTHTICLCILDAGLQTCTVREYNLFDRGFCL
jgi:hypothetical protein